MATEIKSTSIKSQNIIAEPQANKPGSPEQGQIIQATGTGDIAKGIYQYSGASWVSLDNAQGDLETLRLIMSTDTDAVGFSSALNSTSTLAGNTNAVPHETSTGTGMLGALEIPSTGGDALLTEFDANKVFRYYSAGANNNNDYFGIPVDIPAQTRGQNIVIKFKYRTEEASADSSDGDFQVSVWDKSNGVKTTSTNVSGTGAISAGSAITVASSTGMAVGDKIWLESGGNAVNNVGNSITQAYVTEVTSGTSIKISETWTPASTAGSLVVSGWLSDKTSGLLPSADSDTNKVGKDFSIAVKTEEDTAQVVVWFSNKSTTTNVIELFFDGILVSQNKFLQVETQFPYERYFAVGGGLVGTATAYDKSISWSTGTVVTNTIKHTATVEESASNGWTMTMLQDCKINMNATVYDSSDTFNYLGIVVNSADPSDTVYSIATGGTGGVVAINEDMRPGSAGDMHTSCFWSGHVKKGDVIRVQTYQDPTGGGASRIWVDAQPLPSTSIVLESQDEIFSDWQPYTPVMLSDSTKGNWGAAATNIDFWWRRDGGDMLIRGFFTVASTGATAYNAYIDIPSGYAMDIGRMNSTTLRNQLGTYLLINNTNQYYDGNAGNITTNSTDMTNFYLSKQATNGTTMAIAAANNVGGGDSVSLECRLPIAGWNTNFNPLLSMPLVDVGRDIESLTLQDPIGATASSSQRVCYATVLDDTDYSGDLFTYDNNTTTGLKITFNQNVDADVNFGAIATSSQWMGINKNYDSATTGAISVPAANTLAFGNTGPANVRTLPYSGKFKAGDYLHFHCAINTTSSDGDRVTFSITARKDRGNTNMAHIIKPAVAVLTDEKGGTVNGGDSVSTGWTAREINTIRGDSWFVTLSGTGTTGLGGTNKDFTLEPGTYEIEAFGPFYSTHYSQHRLYDKTNSEIVIVGTNNQGSTSTGFVNGPVSGVFNITTSTEYNLEYRVSTAVSTYGLGEDSTFSATGDKSVYANIKIRKLK